MRTIILLFVPILSLLGCANADEQVGKMKALVPIHNTQKIKVFGDFSQLGILLKNDFNLYIDSFYQSVIGREIQTQFADVNSSFNLRDIVVIESKGNVYKKLLGIEKDRFEKSIVFNLHYIQERISPSFSYKGKPAITLGGFALILVNHDKDENEILVSPLDLQVKGGFDCTLKNGLICGDAAKQVKRAPFEESLILNYVRFLLEQNGLKLN